MCFGFFFVEGMDFGAQLFQCLVVEIYNTHPITDLFEDGGTFNGLFMQHVSGIVSFKDNSF
jgi:hypothetical protein